MKQSTKSKQGGGSPVNPPTPVQDLIRPTRLLSKDETDRPNILVSELVFDTTKQIAQDHKVTTLSLEIALINRGEVLLKRRSKKLFDPKPNRLSLLDHPNDFFREAGVFRINLPPLQTPASKHRVAIELATKTRLTKYAGNSALTLACLIRLCWTTGLHELATQLGPGGLPSHLHDPGRFIKRLKTQQTEFFRKLKDHDEFIRRLV